jgi:hypothetical protein
MKKDHLLGLLFFSGMWGATEAILGGFLYSFNTHVELVSIPLTVSALAILTIAKFYMPGRWSATEIGAIAMLYKFLNTPFFGCHLLGIVLLGFCYDCVAHYLRLNKRSALLAVLVTYINYSLFALSITYVFRYPYWIDAGLAKIIRYVIISGTLAACAGGVAVPLSYRLGSFLKEHAHNPFAFTSRLATNSVSLITLSLWLLGIVTWF